MRSATCISAMALLQGMSHCTGNNGGESAGAMNYWWSVYANNWSGRRARVRRRPAERALRVPLSTGLSAVLRRRLDDGQARGVADGHHAGRA